MPILQEEHLRWQMDQINRVYKEERGMLIIKHT